MLNKLFLFTSLTTYSSTCGFIPEAPENVVTWAIASFSFAPFSAKLTVNEKKSL